MRHKNWLKIADNASSPWMKLLMQPLEMLPGHMRVYLGGGNIDMPEHYLDGTQVCTAFQEVAGKGVPEGVGCDFLFDSGLLRIPFDQFPKSLARHGFSGPGHKKITADISFQKNRPGISNIRINFFFCIKTYGNNTFF